jgi:hypothetical protein
MDRSGGYGVGDDLGYGYGDPDLPGKPSIAR